MVSPIRVLQGGAARIAAGDLDQRVDIRTGDELQGLADEVDDVMAARLRESYAGLEQKVEERSARVQARHSNTRLATADVLSAIAASPTDLQPVLEVIAERATKLCAAKDVVICLVENGLLVRMALVGSLPAPPGTEVLPIDRTSVTGRAVVDCVPVQVADLSQADPAEYPLGARDCRSVGVRTFLAVPLLRDGAAVGAICVRREVVEPFTEREIDAAEDVRRPGVIAIENVRLFHEIEEKNGQLETPTGTSRSSWRT